MSCNASQSRCSSASLLSNGTPDLDFSDIDWYSIDAQERAVERFHRTMHAHTSGTRGASQCSRKLLVVIEHEPAKPDHFARSGRHLSQRAFDKLKILVPCNHLLG